MAHIVTVFMQQLRPRIRAGQAATALGEESALCGYPCWAGMKVVILESFPFRRTAVPMKKAFLRLADEQDR